MTDGEKLDILFEKVIDIEKKVTNIENDTSTLKSDVSEIKETVNKNYGMLEEFYVYQKEHNTEITNSLSIIESELEMHNNQIARNTAQLKRVK